MKPTEEQVRRFWRWCGFSVDGVGIYHCPDGISEVRYSPKIDLNNLFKWAVPKLRDEYYVQICTYYHDGEYLAQVDSAMKQGGVAVNKDPALALFWAIWEVMK